MLPLSLPHEVPCVETEGIVPFLEFVQFFDDGGRDDDVVFLELSDALEVMQDYVCVEHEYLRPSGSRPLVGDIGVPCHDMWF